MKYLSEQDKKAIQKIQEYDALPPEGKIVELQRQLKEERARAATAESELASLKQRYEISIDHKDSIIESLKRQNYELEAALEEANNKIAAYITQINAA
jgi:predicted RNase H-like nuclease (RuvC/YqgF family)